MAFDEAVDPGGRRRPAYEALGRRLGTDPLDPPAAVAARLRARPLGDGAWILPVPLAFGAAELAAIAAGVTQRARALQSFFRDVVLGEGRFLADGSDLTPPVLDAILETEALSLERLRRAWATHDRDEIRFVHGPDLARDPEGRWVVLEDNVGCVGGSADSFAVAEAYARAAGLPAPAPATADLARAAQRWPAPAVAVLGCESPGLSENARRARLLGPLGIAAAGEADLASAHPPPRAVLNFDRLAPRLEAELFGRRRLPLLNAPGTALLGSKALLPFVPAMIRFFCDEEPLLGTPPTRVLPGGEPPEPGGQWVVKTSAGAGGTGVFLPGWETAEPDAVRAVVAAAGPCGAVAQRWVESSTLPVGGEPWRVELRPIAYVTGWQDVLAGRPVGKAVPGADRRRLNNVSRGAAYVAVLGDGVGTAAAAEVPSGER